MSNSLLKIDNLTVRYRGLSGETDAVRGISLDLAPGESMAIVGESGCGKSVTALSLARLVACPPGFYAGGSIMLNGRDVLKMSRRELASIRGAEISYVFQEPGTSLNPVFTVGHQIEEAVHLHGGVSDCRGEVIALLERVGLPAPERCYGSYPHELSGGMQQRAMIAMALACRPKLLVADEPTTALDVTIQAQILDLLVSLQDDLGMSVLLITHNLALVADSAQYVNVMYAGRIVESGSVFDVLSGPLHPYSAGLLSAVPSLSPVIDVEKGSGADPRSARLRGIPGSVPHPDRLPVGCKFAPRCSRAQDKCRTSEPKLTFVVDPSVDESKNESQQDDPGRHMARCYFPLSE